MVAQPKPERLFTFPFFFVAFLSLLINGMTTMLFTIIPLYLKEVGASDFMAGLSTTIFTVTSIILRNQSGKTAGKLSARWPIILGMALCAFATFLTGAWQVAVLVLLFRVMYGVGSCFVGTALGKVTADNIPQTRLLEGMGYIGLTSGLATSAGTAVAISSSNAIGYRNVIFVMGTVMAVTSLICFLLMTPKWIRLVADATVSAVNPMEEGGKRMSFFREKEAMPYAVSQALIMLANCSSMTFLAVYCNSIGMMDISLYFVISAVSSVVIRVLAGRIADKHGSGVVLIPSFLLVSLNYLLLPLISELWQLYLLGVLAGAAGGMITPLLQGLMVKKCPGRTGNSSALYYCATDVGLGIGGLLFGLIATWFGYRMMFFLSAAIVIGALAVYLPARKKE